MSKKHLRQLVENHDRFILLAEFVPLPGHKLDNFEKFLRGYAEKAAALPDDVVLGAITIPQSPSGVASMSPADIYSILESKGLWGDLDVICHVTTKDQNVAAIQSYLIGLQKLGLESVLALTGDKPAEGKGVFEVDSIGLIKLINEMNCDSYAGARPGSFDKVHQFYIATAVSPFKYTEGSQMQQYYKMAKKLAVGADCLITQMGWDWRKSEELFRYIKENNITNHRNPDSLVPVFGNVYLLTTMTPAPRLMYEGKLPGCVVTKELFEKVSSESPQQHIERAAQQVAMYRDLGAAGVDLGGLFDFDMLLEIVEKAQQIGSDWQQYKANLDFPVKVNPDGKKAFYLYTEQGRRRELSRPKPSRSKKNFDFMHRTFLEPGRGMHGNVKKLLGRSKGLRQGKGALYNTFFAGEKAAKTLLFECEECGDCFLVENFGICSMGKCEKGLNNPPCGDVNPDGTCGNNVEIRCVGELIYEAAASEGAKGLERLARTINPPRDPALQSTASILNYLFGKDHTKKVPLIQIGENLHASVTKPGAAMKELLGKGPNAYDSPSGALDYIITLIKAQVKHRADYIAINVDVFGEGNPQQSANMMGEYVRLIRRHGQGVPACIDSGDNNILKAGLLAWYKDAPPNIAKPLINSVKTYTMDELLPLNREYPFNFIGLLVDDKQSGADGTYAVSDLLGMARRIYAAATGKYGFQPQEIFMDSTVFPLAIDMPMTPDTPGYTYRAFEAIREIMSDPALKGVHTSLGISNCVKDLPGRRIGICRAYLAKAQEYGLDAAIVNVLHDYGRKPVDPQLLELIDAFAKQDGSAQTSQKAMQMMGEYCRVNRKIKR